MWTKIYKDQNIICNKYKKNLNFNIIIIKLNYIIIN